MIWILAKSGYDEYTIIGVYSSIERAEAARQTIEDAEEQYGDSRRKRRALNEAYVIEAFELDRTGFQTIVRVRADGVVTDTILCVGYHATSSNYEPTFEGRADTFDEALAKARASLP